MKYNIIVILVLTVLVVPTFFLLISSKIPKGVGYSRSMSVALWEDFCWSMLIQGLLIFATVIAILSLVRERIMR